MMPHGGLSEVPDVAQIVVTDTVYIPEETRAMEKVKVLSIAEVLGEGIRRNHKGESMGPLFTFWTEDDGKAE